MDNDILRASLLIRKTEEALLRLYSTGELHGTVHTCIGQELTGVIVCKFLKKNDWVFSNHRCHGHFLSRTDDVTGLIAEVMGKETGVCGGRGGSQHLCKGGFFSNGIQGGILPIATGVALAKKLRHDDTISIAFIGDGTLGEGVVYEVLNIAAKWDLPLLIVLENNQYAQSTHISETLSGSISKRAQAFGMRFTRSDVWNWKHLITETEELINYTRNQGHPAFLQIDTYRLKAHSKGDDLRSIDEIEHFNTIDPINVILSEHATELAEEVAKVQERVNEAIRKAKQARSSSFYGIEAQLQPQSSTFHSLPNQVPKIRLSRAINSAFLEIMAQDKNILFIGEDVKAPYGGAFKISDGLSDSFPGQVINTPISESAIVGIGCGLAMYGYRPFVEIMFGDFLTLAFDQILNHAAKFRDMYNDQVKVPLVIRTPMGAGRGYGPTHSQTLEKHFMGIPGLTILAINNLIDPAIVYKTLAKQEEGPVLLIENKILYTKSIRNAPLGFTSYASDDPFPAVVVSPLSTNVDAVIFGYGGLSDLLVDVAEELFVEHDVIAQVICPLQIYPFSVIPYIKLVSKCKIAIIVEEGQGFAGFGSEVVAQLTEILGKLLPRTIRIYPSSMAIPSSKALENLMIPGKDMLIERILKAYISEAEPQQ
ncbi:dehydrogenase E1 component subunit alpha/beta [Photorhabdus luminescens]|uniref:Pyruvate dehydrogenase n=1 Tax=Photorhabdus luminescens subsp. sonorensis TaxID=1173677 RepID=A0A5C4RI29_PHOLU|nr:thiamine pyrophosphate-dependent enzyme [Photorhabdus luminescens]TNH43736.1 pyruvate dehydrogenase [Photorhabdus luminescens subsp. sonorensis]